MKKLLLVASLAAVCTLLRLGAISLDQNLGVLRSSTSLNFDVGGSWQVGTKIDVGIFFEFNVGMEAAVRYNVINTPANELGLGVFTKF